MMGRTIFMSWRRTASMALALVLAVLMIGSAIQPVGAADERVDQLKDYCESKGGWLVRWDDNTFYCHGEGFFEECEVYDEGIIASICVEMTAMQPEQDDPRTYPPLTRPDDGTLESANLDAERAVQDATSSTSATTASQTTMIAERED